MENFIPPPLNANEARQAHEALRGYSYQIWHSVLSWLKLNHSDILYLEGAEDIDLFCNDKYITTQIKDLPESSISLNNNKSLEALGNFYDILSRNSNIVVEYQYLFSSRIVEEKGSPFGKGVKGIDLWRECQALYSISLDKSIDSAIKIRSFLQARLDSNSPLKSWIDNLKPVAFLTQFILRFRWISEESNISAIRASIRNQLIVFCSSYSIPPTEAERLDIHFYDEAMSAAIAGPSRPLQYSDIFRIIENNTHISIPRNAVSNLNFSSLLGLTSQSSISTYEAITELTDQDAYVKFHRDSLYKLATSQLHFNHFVWIHGETGIGKSTLAKELAMNESLKFVLDCKSESSNSLQAALAHAFQHLPSLSCLIIDDLDLTINYNKVEHTLVKLIRKLSLGGGKCIITSYQPIPLRLVQLLNFPSPPGIKIPYFTLEEVENYLIQKGCPNHISKQWSAVIFAQTKGHPQLVDIRLTTLVNLRFPTANLAEASKIDSQIEEIKSEILNLVNELSPELKSMLYTLSLIHRPFKYTDALKLSDNDYLFPGEVLRSAIGPWLEKLNDTYLRISPLLENAALKIWPDHTLLIKYQQIGRAVLSSTEITQVELDIAIVNSIKADDCETLIKACSIIITIPISLLPQMSTSLSHICLMGINGKLPISDPFAKRLFRLTQVILSDTSCPSLTAEIIQEAELDFNFEPSDLNELWQKISYFIKVLILSNAKLSFPILLPKMPGLKKLLSKLKNFDDEQFHNFVQKSFLENTDISHDLISFILFKVESVDDISNFLNAFVNLSKDDQETYIHELKNENGLIKSLFMLPWIKSSQDQDAANLFIPVLERAYHLGKSIRFNSLSICAYRALSMILDEVLDSPELAINKIQVVVDEFGPSNGLMEQLTMIYFRQSKFRESLEISRELLQKWSYSDNFDNPSFCAQRAAISAGKLNEWNEAAQLFQLASQTVWQGGEAFQVCFLADCGIAYWKAGQKIQSFEILETVLLQLEKIPTKTDDTRIKFLRIILSQLLQWMHSPHEFPNPNPAECSNLSPNFEAISNIDSLPNGLLWALLIRVEEKNFVYSAYDKFIRILDSQDILIDMKPEIKSIISSSITRAAISKAIFFLSWNDYPKLVVDLSNQLFELHHASKAATSHLDPVLERAKFVESVLQTYIIVHLIRSAGNSLNFNNCLYDWISKYRGSLDSEVIDLMSFSYDLINKPRIEIATLLHDQNQNWFVQVICAICMLVGEPDSSETTFIASLRLIEFCMNNRSEFRIICKEMDAVLIRGWKSTIKNKLIFRSMNQVIPALTSILSEDIPIWKRAHQLLTVSTWTVKYNLPEGFLASVLVISQDEIEN